MADQRHAFHFTATGIGSVPFLDVEETCREILSLLPLMPFWPQFVKKSLLEDMSIQYAEGLPLLALDQDRRALHVPRDAPREEELVSFYESYLAEDADAFAVSPKRARGLHRLLDLVAADQIRPGAFIKGQSVGPLTFAAGIMGPAGKPVLHDPELLEALTKGLAIKALWQVSRLAATGRRPVLFLDEPYLSGFGSAFTPIAREQVVNCLAEIISYLRERTETLVGIHCCGNTDWAMIAEAGPDIINFDAYSFLDAFLLYPEALGRFLEAGGVIAWGIVPTSGDRGAQSIEELHRHLKGGLERVAQWGFSPEQIAQASLLTPACGMGTMEPDAARAALGLLSELSRRCRDEG